MQMQESPAPMERMKNCVRLHYYCLRVLRSDSVWVETRVRSERRRSPSKWLQNRSSHISQLRVIELAVPTTSPWLVNPKEPCAVSRMMPDMAPAESRITVSCVLKDLRSINKKVRRRHPDDRLVYSCRKYFSNKIVSESFLRYKANF